MQLQSLTIPIFVSPLHRKLILWVQSFPLNCNAQKEENKEKFAAKHMEMTLEKLGQSLSAFNLLLEGFFRAANYLQHDKQPVKAGITQLSGNILLAIIKMALSFPAQRNQRYS